MNTISLNRAWRVLVDSLCLGLIRASMTVIQTAVDALRLDSDGRRAVLAELGRMILPPSPPLPPDGRGAAGGM